MCDCHHRYSSSDFISVAMVSIIVAFVAVGGVLVPISVDIVATMVITAVIAVVCCCCGHTC